MATEANPKIGDLRHRVTIQTPTSYMDSDGTPTKGWDTVAVTWAAVMYVKPNKVMGIAERASSNETYQIDIRAREIPSNARIQWAGKTLYVQGSGDVWGTSTWTRIWADNHQGDNS